jgi:hypothetical protein
MFRSLLFLFEIYFNLVTGVVSAIFGVYYMYNLGVNEGLFHLGFNRV